MILAEKCSCPPGECASLVDPPDACVNRLPGAVGTMHCPDCCPPAGASWHQDGVCLRCADRLAEAIQRRLHEDERVRCYRFRDGMVFYDAVRTDILRECVREALREVRARPGAPATQERVRADVFFTLK